MNYFIKIHVKGHVPRWVTFYFITLEPVNRIFLIRDSMQLILSSSEFFVPVGVGLIGFECVVNDFRSVVDVKDGRKENDVRAVDAVGVDFLRAEAADLDCDGAGALLDLLIVEFTPVVLLYVAVSL